MTKWRLFCEPYSLVVAALLCAAGTWTYADRVLIPYQKSDAAAHDRPRGNLSDLYPRWVGTRELLLHGRDPYSAEVTRDIQVGYYGRQVDPSRPKDPHDEQGFAYPVYVVFCLAPTIGLPFPIVQKGFFWAMAVLTSVSTLLWIRVFRWAVPLWAQIGLLALALGSLSVMQGLRVQQMSLLVAGLVAIAIALLVAGREIPAGILLALATIKPQLMVLPILWLIIWTISDWRRRYRWALSFLCTMAILTAVSEWYLDHWIPRFWHAVQDYRRYTGTTSVIGLLIGGVWGDALEVLAFAAFLGVCWLQRRQAANSAVFAFTVSLVLATTILLVPTYGPYNQVLLIPACLTLIKDRQTIWQGGVGIRLIAIITVMVVLWPWLSSIVLAILSFVLPRQTIEQAWAIPLWTVTQIPVGVAGLMLIHYYQMTFNKPARPGAS